MLNVTLHTVCSINSQAPDQPCAAIDVKIKNSIGRTCEFLEIFFVKLFSEAPYQVEF